eukprot:CAMPEP_0172313828 /NCGR_PEP_ID=MMETSP1058-20130122/21073_1 /TAXON_ID=83371 /ORGANISM="Detonula confervacea, Strain CCMP 353" /LENGTH=209 /DNA_ID=CAMNT_0013027545 /DNA_START=18 /DNA_END=647 /DNA_ORIENTATION=+
MGKDDDNAQHDDKRQRLGGTNEQRNAFEEDMARIRSAVNNNVESSAACVESAEDDNSGDGRLREADSASAAGAGERLEAIPDHHRQGVVDRRARSESSSPQLQQQQGGESTSSLQHQQRPLGEQQQHQSQQITHAPSITRGDASGQRSMDCVDSEDEEEGDAWLQNFTPRHTRVGANYQVADLPTAPPTLPRNAPPSSSCVSPGGSGGS